MIGLRGSGISSNAARSRVLGEYKQTDQQTRLQDFALPRGPDLARIEARDLALPRHPQK